MTNFSRSSHLVDPEILPALELIPELDIKPADIPALREASSAALPALESYTGSGVELRRITVPGDDRGPAVEVILHRPVDARGALPLFLHIHGGGYVFGEALANVPGNIRTALDVGCVVASVDYRLAPDAQGTSAVEDCYRALTWLVRNSEQFGLDADRIAIGGESAGGGLAAALALLVRDRAEIRLCFQMLIYPMLDCSTGRTDDAHPYCGEFVWSASANRMGWDCLTGGIEPAADGHVSPARAADLTGLPAAYISVGALDLFLEEDIEYARRLMRAGVPVELHVYPGAFHGFELAAEARISIRAEQERREALARAFAINRP